MANKKTYTIEIAGVKESYESVSSLADVLDKLTDKVVKVGADVQKETKATKEARQGTDELTKAKVKLLDYDREYEEELQRTRSELSKQKKEVSDLIKQEEAASVVEAKQLDSYADKQKYLTSLNKLIRTHANVTEEDKAQIAEMVQESAKLQAELKAFDEEMKIYSRNVGNYPEAAQMVIDSQKSIKQELKETQDAMAQMLLNGVDKTDEKFQSLAQRAGELKDAMADASDEISHFASDTQTIDNVINLAQTATSVWGLYSNAMQAFGIENKEVEESMKSMMAVMSTLQQLQALQNSLTAQGSATMKVYNTVVNTVAKMLGLKSTAVEADTVATEANAVANEANAVATEANAAAKATDTAATEASTVANTSNTASETANTAATGANTVSQGANTTAKGANTAATNTLSASNVKATATTNALSVAQKAGAVASKILSVALRSIPLMFIIGLVVTLITHWTSIWNWFKKTFPVLDTLSRKFKQFGGFINTVKATLVGFGKAIVNWVVNPVKTLAKVLERLFALDFEGAYNAVKNGLENQFKGSADAFKKGFQAQVEKGLDDIAAKEAETANKTTQQQLEELKIRERNNKTYSKRYIDLQKKDFAERRKMAKGNQEELNKIKLEEMQFDAECEDKKTAYAKEQASARTSAAKAATAETRKAQTEANKAAEEYKKRIEDLYKTIEQTVQKSDNLIKQGVQLQRKTYEAYFKELQTLWTETFGKRYKEYLTETGEADREWVLMAYDNAEKYAFKRKMLVYQTFAEEVDETRKTYKTLLNEITTLIQKTSAEAQKATGDTKEKLESQLASLQLTFKNVQKSMEDLLGEYAGDLDFQIPLTFDTNEIIKRIDEIKDRLSDATKGMFNYDSVLKFLQDTGKMIEQVVMEPANEYSKEYFLAIAEALNGDTQEVKDLKAALDLLSEDIDDLSKLPDSFKATKKAMEENGDVIAGLIEDMRQLTVGSNIAIDRLNIMSKEILDNWKKLDDEISESVKKTNEDTLKEIVATADKLINYNEKVIKKFQDAAKGLKIEPVKVDDAFTKTFDGQIMSIDKTRERYEKLRKAYEEYQETIRVNMGKEAFEKEWQKIIDDTIEKYGEGSKEWASVMNKHQLESIKRNEAEKLWQDKLDATLRLYGKDSVEYKLMLDEKAKADAQYAMEYEKTQEQIQLIDKKTNSIYADYAESLGKRIQDIYKAFSENMFEPLADGFTALLDYQIEEAEERLEKVEKLLDKAVDLREESEEKIEEINDKLRESDTGNTEALKQQLADEMVLLVQRQQNERDLQKQKEREEALIQKKQRQQRKIELGQKLIEGIVNTAVGVTAALKYGPILGPIFAAIIGAMGALQTGIIIKQMSKLEKGGLLKGKSHKQGGMRVEGTNIEVEGGEFVVNKKSTTKYINLIEAINEDNPVKVRRLSNRYDMGGRLGKPTTIINNYNHTPLVSSSMRKYAQGGKLDYGKSVAAIEQNSAAVRVSDAISQIDFHPQVAVVDIERKQKNLTKVRDISGK